MTLSSTPNQLNLDASQVKERPWVKLIVFLFAMSYAIYVLYWFHDRFWLPADEGVYSHIADRILAGEVPNRDVKLFHPGYDSLANSFAFMLFGKDLLSLRYPLVAMTFLSCAIIFMVIARRNVFMAFVSVIGISSLSVIQFLNPAAYWYCCFLFTLIIGCLTWMPIKSCYRIEIVGFLVATIFGFHQLVGVHTAIGVLAYLLYELPQSAKGSDRWVSRLLYSIMAIGLASYCWTHVEEFAFLTYAIWPLSILVMGLLTSKVPNRDSLRLIGQLVVGSVIALSPIIFYHLFHGTITDWFYETFILILITQDNSHVVKQHQYINLVKSLLWFISNRPSIITVSNGLFWILLIVLPAALGASVLRNLGQRLQSTQVCAPLPFLACFFALVSLRIQIPIYLFFTVSFTMAGLCWISAERRIAIYATSGLLLFLSLVGLLFHAGQPLIIFSEEDTRFRSMVGDDQFKFVALDLPRATLMVDEGSRDVYQWLVKLIERESEQNESIFAVPYNPELYFLTQRQNFTRYHVTAFGIRNEEMLNETIARMRLTPPRLVIYRDDDKYNTDYSRQLMDHVRKHYRLLESQNGFEVYRWYEHESKLNAD